MRSRVLYLFHNTRSMCDKEKSVGLLFVRALCSILIQHNDCESAFNLDPWQNRRNVLQSNDFREEGWGRDWTPIEHFRDKQFRVCFNDLARNRRGVQVG